MTEYQSPKAVTEGNNPEGVYMASGGTPPTGPTIVCQSVWRKGIWAPTDRNAYISNPAITKDQARGCEGCPANWGAQGCGLLVGDPSNFLNAWNANALKPAWEYSGIVKGDEPDSNKNVGVGWVRQ